MSNEEKVNAKVKEFAIKKLRLEEARIAPEITKKVSRWDQGLLKRISEVEVRAGKESIVSKIDAETGEIVGWRFPSRKIGSEVVKLTEEEAIRIAKSELEIPQDAVFDSVEFLKRGTPGLTCFVRWKRMKEGIPIEGEFIIVKINPETKEVISVTKNWSVILT